MYRNFTYANYELWDHDRWKIKYNTLTALIRKIGEMPEERGKVDENPDYAKDKEEVMKLPGYIYKSGSYDDPAVAAYWRDRGMIFATREGGAVRSIPFFPIVEEGTTFPVLIVYHKEDYGDPFWALKTLELYKDYCEKAAVQKDHGVCFVVTNNAPDMERSQSKVAHACISLGADPDRLYLDISSVLKNGIKLCEIEDFIYKDVNGRPVADPDSCIESFEGVSVLDISHRCNENFSLTYISSTLLGQHDGQVDFGAIRHSETGKSFMEGMALEYYNDSEDDPAVKEQLKQWGLECTVRYNKSVKWTVLMPGAVQEDRKLPLLVVFHGDDSVVASISFYLNFVKIAAQGECVLMFCGGCWQEGEKIREIIETAETSYPVDGQRIYVTGHSHFGHLAQYFMRTYPELVAAAAPLNNAPFIPLPDASGEDPIVSKEDVEKMSRYDIPLVVLAGCHEAGCMFPINQQAAGFNPGINIGGYAATAEGRAKAWNLRLKAARVPQQSLEEILNARFSDNKATRELGIPSDCARTVFMDGFEHYIADFKNVDGKYHLQIIGEENMLHVPSPSMQNLAWNFMRRFARDRETGEIIDLF